MHWVFVAACRFSPVVVSRGQSLVAVLRLLIAVASLAAEQGLQSTGSVVVGEWAQLRGMRNHPRPGLNPVMSISKNTAITQDAGVSRMEGVLSVC